MREVTNLEHAVSEGCHFVEIQVLVAKLAHTHLPHGCKTKHSSDVGLETVSVSNYKFLQTNVFSGLASSP